MSWKPNTTHAIRIHRARMLHNIRGFFYERDVLEVETPALSLAANTDPYIDSFQLDITPNSRYLHTSPEYPMKRLLATGSGDIYQIAKVWRKGESGSQHNPEFTLLEWYRLGFSYHRLIQEVDDILTPLITSLQQPALIVTYQQLFLEKLGIDPHTVSHAELVACCQLHVNGLDKHLISHGLSHQDLLDALLTHCIEPDFENDRLTFVIDYPVSQSALAAIRGQAGDIPAVAMRFEVYFGSLELGNGYQEETSHRRNNEILRSENEFRHKRQNTKVPEDKLFLDAIKAGLPECSGVAIGLDRVLMAITGENSIKQVINFPWDKA